MKLKLSFLFLLFAGITVAQSTKKILFIGNSYTSVNNLPQLLHDLAIMNNDTIIFDSNIPGGYTFMMHSTDATTLSKISSQPWDYVILQEQSQTPSFPPSQVESDCYPYAKRLDSLIKANDSCTRTIFYMTWGRKYGDASNCASYPPLCTFEGMNQRLRDSYLEMADSNKTFVAPVGAAFRNSRIADSTINLYQTDYSHPSAEGSYLAACVFYSTIYNKTTIANPFMSSLGHGTAVALQTIAKQTVLDSLTNWRIGKYALPKSCGAIDTTHQPNGVNEFTKNEISIYPNPVNNVLLCKCANMLINTIEVTNVLGQVCITPLLHKVKGDVSINVATLPNGIYFLKLTTNDGLQVIKKFVKE
jgi:Secretion system C-terminal sorting domain